MKPGDGIVYDYGKPQEDEPGGRVSYLWKRNIRVDLADRPDAVEFEVWECPPPQVGWKVWKTNSASPGRKMPCCSAKTSRCDLSPKVEVNSQCLRK